MLVTYKFQEGSESLSSHTGLGLAGALLERTELKDRLAGVELPGCMELVIAHSDMVFLNLIQPLCDFRLQFRFFIYGAQIDRFRHG